jgi:predicted O-linked N-acetylglucosamine transferase (SPINDLY family)
VDVLLDPYPWGGGITSFEAFALCVPVVTLPAATTVMQLTLGQYRQMGLAELLAPDVRGYIRKAVAVANDPLLSSRLRRRICR